MPNSLWRIEMLGGLRVTYDGSEITRFKTSRTAEVLAYVAYFSIFPRLRTEIAGRIWPDAPAASGRDSLRSTISSLRKQLEVVPHAPLPLLVTNTSLALNRASVETDIAEFEREAGAAAENGTNRIEHLQRAVDLYGGEFLAGQRGEWLELERERLVSLFLSLASRLVAERERRGELDHALVQAQRITAVDPFNEDAHRSLMRLYAATGQVAAAKKQIRTLRRVLEKAGWGAPSAETIALSNSLAAPGQAVASAPLPTPPSDENRVRSRPSRHMSASARPRERRVPAPATAFFGRDSEIAHIVGLLNGTHSSFAPVARFVTLVGTGGIGKTRLALEVARRTEEEVHALFYVPLAGAGSFEQFLAALLQALRLSEDGAAKPIESIAQRLGQHATARLILDNFEQLLSRESEPGTQNPCSSFLEDLLERLPGLTCLVTSRRPLNCPSEHPIPVRPLKVPEPGSDIDQIREAASVRLFIDRVRRRKVDFSVTARNAPILAGICRTLEGIPLAIELAAAQAHRIPASEMQDRLADALGFLVTPQRPTTRRAAGTDEAARRHLTLRTTIAWSYDLLDDELKQTLIRLSIFRGWSNENASAALEQRSLAETVRKLQDHSLVQAENTTEDRFRMLEVIREFADEKLQPEERRNLEARHAAEFLRVARASIEKSHGPDQGKALAEIDLDLDNIRQALRATMGTEACLNLAAAMHQFWYVRGYLAEGIHWMQSALQGCPEAQDNLRSSNLNALGVFTWSSGDLVSAEKSLGEAVALRERSGDTLAVAGLNNNLGTLALSLRNIAVARARLETSVRLHRELGHDALLAHALHNLGTVALAEEKPAEADRLFEESLTLAQRGRDELCIANAREQQGVLALLRGDNEAAARCFGESLRTRRHLKDRRYLVALLLWTAALANRRGRRAHAARLLAASDALRESIGYAMTPTEEEGRRKTHASLVAELDRDSLAVYQDEGRQFSAEQAIDYALGGLKD